MSIENIKNLEMEYRNIPSAGKQLNLYFDKSFDMMEYTTCSECMQPVLKDVNRRDDGYLPSPAMVGCEPFVQFSPKEYDAFIESIYKRIVELWNDNRDEVRRNVQ